MSEDNIHSETARFETESDLEVHVEVTTTLAANFTGGFERLVRSILKGLDQSHHRGIRMTPVTWSGSGYRRLTDDEHAYLETHPPGGTNRRRADRYGSLTPLLRRAVALPGVGSTREYLRNQRRRWSLSPNLKALEMGLPGYGSVWLDLEPSWNDPEPRAELLARLRVEGIQTAVLVADVMPELFPDWFDPDQTRRFGDWLQAHLDHSSLFLCISKQTEADLLEVAKRRGVTEQINTVVIPLGADGPTEPPVEVDLPETANRYLLVVGTLEPRKNQQLLIDAFDRLAQRHDDLALVLVGRQGWLVEDLADRIRGHKMFQSRLIWPDAVSDGQLAWLYQNAYLTVAPSLYEGLGVPVMEALRYGSPTISSDGGALPEAGNGYTETFAPDDLDALCVLIERHLLDPAYHQKLAEQASDYSGPTWDESAIAVAEALLPLKGQS